MSTVPTVGDAFSFSLRKTQWDKVGDLSHVICAVIICYSGRYAAAAGPHAVLTGWYRTVWCADEQRVVGLEIQLHGTNKISVPAAAIHT